jgi:aminoglycoside phosphotransferase (APT) family kinase protein
MGASPVERWVLTVTCAPRRGSIRGMPEEMAPPGIDVARVTAWLHAHVEGTEAAALTFELVGDGRSNLTYRVANAAGTWALRRPPLGHIVATAHDMRREFRVLRGVTGRGFPAPRPIALCEDPKVNEHPFYVMEYVDGVILTDRLPAGFATEPGERRAISRAFVETMARLHAIDYEAIGLGDFGRPAGYLERQVKRWAVQWEANKTRELPAIDELQRRLERALPAQAGSTIVHGDYRLGNIILAREEPGRIAAVLDWEMSTLGDPLADLGYTLAYWRGPADTRPQPGSLKTAAQVTSAAGFFRREELIAEYERLSGRDVSHIDFYEVFAYYKLAVISEGIYRRIVEGKQLGRGLEDYGKASEELTDFALAVADASEDRRLRGA